MTLRPGSSKKITKFKLPKFPATVAPTFKRLCETLAAEKLPALKMELDHCMAEIEENAQKNQQCNIKLARELYQRCKFLLEHYQEFSPKDQAMIIGAIRYFAIAEDPFPDQAFAAGFNDDAKVLNYVLQEIGITGMFLELR